MPLNSITADAGVSYAVSPVVSPTVSSTTATNSSEAVVIDLQGSEDSTTLDYAAMIRRRRSLLHSIHDDLGGLDERYDSVAERRTLVEQQLEVGLELRSALRSKDIEKIKEKQEELLKLFEKQMELEAKQKDKSGLISVARELDPEMLLKVDRLTEYLEQRREALREVTREERSLQREEQTLDQRLNRGRVQLQRFIKLVELSDEAAIDTVA